MLIVHEDEVYDTRPTDVPISVDNVIYCDPSEMNHRTAVRSNYIYMYLLIVCERVLASTFHYVFACSNCSRLTFVCNKSVYSYFVKIFPVDSGE